MRGNIKRFFILICCLFCFSEIITVAIKNERLCMVNGMADGICKTIEDCAEILYRYKVFRQIPIKCPSVNGEMLFCCPSPKVSTTTVSSTTTEDPMLGRVKSYQKCKEYAEYVYSVIDAPIALATADKEKDDTCSHSVEELVTGGMDAKSKEFPHMAVLGYVDGDKPPKWACGGSLISDEFILTAAHCIINVNNAELKLVRVGDLNIMSTDDDALPQEFGIADIIVHEYGAHKYNDIALIRLDDKVKLNPYVIPACLSWRDHIQEKTALATGWGLLNTSGNPSDILQKVILELFPNEECNTAYRPFMSKRVLPNGITLEKQICAGHRNMSKDTCKGDSGSPLQVYQKDNIHCMYSIIGVTSFSISECGSIGFPGVYTKVSYYRKWIEDNVWK